MRMSEKCRNNNSDNPLTSRCTYGEKLLLTRTCKIAAVYDRICSCLHILPPFFMHNFPRHLGQNTYPFFISMTQACLYASGA